MCNLFMGTCVAANVRISFTHGVLQLNNYALVSLTVDRCVQFISVDARIMPTTKYALSSVTSTVWPYLFCINCFHFC